MNATQIIFEVLCSGGAWSHEELQAKTGLPLDAIKGAMHVLRRRGHQAMEPTRYAATKSAKSHLAATILREERLAALRASKTAEKPRGIGRPRLPEEVRLANDMARRRALVETRRKKRQQARAEAAAATKQAQEDAELAVVRRIVAAPAVADSIVSTAVQSRPAIQAVWGVAHA